MESSRIKCSCLNSHLGKDLWVVSNIVVDIHLTNLFCNLSFRHNYPQNSHIMHEMLDIIIETPFFTLEDKENVNDEIGLLSSVHAKPMLESKQRPTY